VRSNALLRQVSIPCQPSLKKNGQKLGSAHARGCSSVGYTCRPSVEPPPKSLRQSVERAYWGRRQPWEQATTIKTLVSGSLHCDIADPTRLASFGTSFWGCGVVTADPGMEIRIAQVSISECAVVPASAACSTVDKVEMHIVAFSSLRLRRQVR
jgi:hypothetical protein